MPEGLGVRLARAQSKRCGGAPAFRQAIKADKVDVVRAIVFRGVILAVVHVGKTPPGHAERISHKSSETAERLVGEKIEAVRVLFPDPIQVAVWKAGGI